MKLFKIIVIVLVFLGISLATASYFLGKKISPLLMKEINSNVSTNVSFRDASFSLFRSFPRASVIFSDLTVLSSPGFSKSEFKVDTDTLLYTESAFFEFRVTDILRRKYVIERIRLRNGLLSLLTDKSGSVNYEITSGGNEGNNELEIEIKGVTVSGLQLTYINNSTGIMAAGMADNVKIKSRLTGELIDFTCSGLLTAERLKFGKSVFSNRFPVQLDLTLHTSASATEFGKSSISVPGLDFSIEGEIGKDGNVNIKAAATKVDLMSVRKLLPASVLERISDYEFGGKAEAEIMLKGKTTKQSLPAFDASFNITDGNVTLRKSELSAGKISLKGSLKSETGAMSEATAFADLLNVEIGTAVWKGQLKIRNFQSPYVEGLFSGELIPVELVEFLKLDFISDPAGKANLAITFSGKTGSPGKFSFKDFFTLNPEGTLVLNSLGFTYNKSDLSVEDASGNIMFSNTLWADDLAFTLNNNRFGATGSFSSFSDWIAGKPAVIKIDADISTDKVEPGKLFRRAEESKTSQPPGYRFPGGTLLNIRLSAGTLLYNDFSAENLKCTIEYKPGKLTVKSLQMNSMDGSISGNCSLYQNRDYSFVARGDISVSAADINKTFKGFRNFRQDFIRAENLGGVVSGDVTFLLPLDSMMNPRTSQMIAEGKYTIENGVLQNFEPVKALSKFIEVSELEKIEFSKLQNELLISDNTLSIPAMDIESTAADFSVSGRHGFDNKYEYHIKVRLSEILSKGRERMKNNTEFGAVEDDGLGRTSIFLKLNGDDEDLKVTYDLKSATGKLKENIKNEKNNLRNIIREEYGKHSADTQTVTTSAPKPKFKIEWSETGSSGEKPDSSVTQKERGINRIFRKKKI